jgi:hypothetical protein
MADDPGRPIARRLYVRDGKVYLIRDMYVGSRYLGHEYAILNKDVQLCWRPFRDGDVPWSEIQPLGEVEHDT